MHTPERYHVGWRWMKAAPDPEWAGGRLRWRGVDQGACTGVFGRALPLTYSAAGPVGATAPSAMAP